MKFLQKTRTTLRIAWYGGLLCALYGGLQLWKGH
jgi:hypothetical protein